MSLRRKLFGPFARSSAQPARALPARARTQWRAVAAFEQLEGRTLFGFYSADPVDEIPVPAENPCPPASQDPDAGAASASTTGKPVRHFDGVPVISSGDLSSEGFGFSWGHTRVWTGLNNASFNGNGWAIAELPYVVVGGGAAGTQFGYGTVDPNNNSSGVFSPESALDQRISVVGNGTLTFDVDVPSDYTAGTYASYPAWGAHRNTLTWDKTNRVLKFTDPFGNVTEFYDVRRASDVTDPSDPYYALRAGGPSPDPDRPIPYSRGSGSSQKYGQFKRFIAANGTTTAVASYDSNGYPTSVTRSDPSTNERERYRFDYTGDTGFTALTNDLVTAASGAIPRFIARTTLERSDNAGASWTTVRTVDYTYYTGRLPGGGGFVDDPNGRLGDLKYAKVKDGLGNTIDTTYYRYYKFTGEGHESAISHGPTNQHTTTGGPAPLNTAGTYNPGAPSYPNRFVQSGLKTVVENASFDRLAASVANYEAASDATIQPYVNHYFEYERWADHVGSPAASSYDYRIAYRLGTRYRVTKEIAQGAGCSTCSGGMGTFKIEYESNDWYNYPNDDNLLHLGYDVVNYNTWRVRTTEYLPDTTESDWTDNDRNIVYVNEVGQPMLEVLVDANGTSLTSDDKAYATYSRYDDQGRRILLAQPSAVATYLPTDPSDESSYVNPAPFESYPDLIGFNGSSYANLNPSAGLIEVTEYGTSTTANATTAGDVKGYFKAA
jgi:hypothetical protein